MNRKTIITILFTAATLALLGAYASQYFFNFKPCILCLYQRIPFFIIAFLCVFGWFLHEKWQKIVVFLCFLAIFANLGLALYHVGVEQKIFKITQKCVAIEQNFATVEELQQHLAKQELARCDDPQFVFAKLSMAAWNAVFCLILMIFLGSALFRR